jgi:hypothetical protein
MKTLKNMFQVRTHKYFMLVLISVFFLHASMQVSANPDQGFDGIAEGPLFESVIPEAEPMLEEWMSVPFENTYTEAELMVEEWMTAPFENTYTEPELVVEDWMTAPFEDSFTEPDLVVEDWMTSPF